MYVTAPHYSPNLDIAHVGVPRTIAMNLTFPERVTKFNKSYLRKLIANGPNVHPGAKTIIRDDGSVIDLRYSKGRNDEHLETGYIVERHIVDEDVIMFNRQPSLHKMSIMCHRVKVMPFSTFRLNLSCTSPYNADFDGDEMNMHICQTVMTRAEALNIMFSPRQVVSPQGNKPVMGIVQDSLLAVYKLTKRDCFLDRAHIFSTLMHLGRSRCNLCLCGVFLSASRLVSFVDMLTRNERQISHLTESLYFTHTQKTQSRGTVSCPSPPF
jgi:DNA-directed RNA polymerase II subunit RPB1